MDQFDIPLTPEGKIIDFLTGNALEAKLEEFVRQQYLRVLHFEYQYPKTHLASEVPIYYGSKELKDSEGRPVRADIVIYSTASARTARDQGKIEIIVECKAPKLQAITNSSPTFSIRVLTAVFGLMAMLNIIVA